MSQEAVPDPSVPDPAAPVAGPPGAGAHDGGPHDVGAGTPDSGPVTPGVPADPEPAGGPEPAGAQEPVGGSEPAGEQEPDGAPKTLLEQMEEMMAALNADLSRLDRELQDSLERPSGSSSAAGQETGLVAGQDAGHESADSRSY